MRPLNIAHRGGADLWPENTLAAFRHAVATGADGAELDVQLTRDGKVVVFHDNRLKADLCRNANGQWLAMPGAPIVNLSYAEIRSYDVGRARPGSEYALAHPALSAVDGERIPLLSEVIEIAKAAANPFWLFVELKTSFSDRSLSASPQALAEATLAVLRAQDYLAHTILVGFDWPGLLHAKKLERRVTCWFTTLAQSWFREGAPPPDDDPPAEPALQMLRHWAATGSSPWAGGFDAVNYGGSILRAINAAGGDGWFPFYRDADEAAVHEARALGLKVGAWTVDEPADMRRLVRLDALCTDRPDILADELIRVR